jgi:hypothetical protein
MKLTPIRHPCPLGEKARLYFKPLADGRLQCGMCNKPVKELVGCSADEIAKYITDNPGTCIILGRKPKS